MKGRRAADIASLRALGDKIAARLNHPLNHIHDRDERTRRAAEELEWMGPEYSPPPKVNDTRALADALEDNHRRRVALQDRDPRPVLMEDGRVLPATHPAVVRSAVAGRILDRQFLELLLAVENAAALLEAGRSAEAQLVVIVLALAGIELAGGSGALLDSKLSRLQSARDGSRGGKGRRARADARLAVVRDLAAKAPPELKREALAGWILRQLPAARRDELGFEKWRQVYNQLRKL
jgi:hypothetical protein